MFKLNMLICWILSNSFAACLLKIVHIYQHIIFLLSCRWSNFLSYISNYFFFSEKNIRPLNWNSTIKIISLVLFRWYLKQSHKMKLAEKCFILHAKLYKLNATFNKIVYVLRVEKAIWFFIRSLFLRKHH